MRGRRSRRPGSTRPSPRSSARCSPSTPDRRGTGEFGHVDLATGRSEPFCFLQSYARCLAFVGEHAVIGFSRPRENRTFDGLALNERLAREDVGPLCHLAVVNLLTGDIEHRLVIEGVGEELYDVAALPGVLRPMAIGFRSDEIRFLVRPAPR